MLLLFDLDGTVTDSNTLWQDVDAEFARRRGLAVTQEYTDFVIHAIFPTAADFTKEYYHLKETPQQIMEEWHALAYEAYACHCPAKPGAAEFLTRCKAQGIRMAMVTASVPELCEAALKRLGLGDCFTFILYAQELGLEKRRPQVWLEAARRAGISPADCIVFDDSPVACAAARQAGCRDVGVYDPLYAPQQAEMRRDCWRYIESFEGFSLV